MASGGAEGACLICNGTYSSKGSWIHCSAGCDRYFHTACVGLSNVELNWKCVVCTTYGQAPKTPHQESISLDNASLADLLDAITLKVKNDKPAQKPMRNQQELTSDSDESILDMNKILAARRQANSSRHPSIPPVYQGNLFRPGNDVKKPLHNLFLKKDAIEDSDGSHRSERSRRSVRDFCRIQKTEMLESSPDNASRPPSVPPLLRPKVDVRKQLFRKQDGIDSDCSHRSERSRRSVSSRIRKTQMDESSSENEFEESVSQIRRNSHRSTRKTPSFPYNSHNHNSGNDMAALVMIMKQQQLEKLPIFTGEDPAGWRPFYLQYKSTTTAASFTDDDNFRRLSTYVDGKAKRLIKNILVDSSCVSSAIQELKNHYGRTGTVVKNMVRKLRNMKPPIADNVESLLEFRKELNDGYLVLKNLGASQYLENPTIADDIVDKFPVTMRKEWHQHIVQKLRIREYDVILEDLVEWVLDTTHWTLSERKRDVKANVFRQRVSVHEDYEDEPVEQSNVHEELKRKLCLHCDENTHKIIKCKKFENLNVQKKWEVAKKKKLCFCCLEKWHKDECPVKKAGKVCGIDKCDKFHHQLLHNPKKVEQTAEMQATVRNNDQRATYFKIIPVKIYGNGTVIEANAFFDDGSAPTMMTKELASKLGVTGEKSNLYLSWTDNRVKVEKDSEKVVIEISGIDSYDKKFKLRNVKTVSQSNLDLPLPIRNIQELQRKCGHLKGIQIPEPFNKKPEILIGLEHPKLGVAKEVREGSWQQPIASKTPLGWVIHGKSSDPVNQNFQRLCVVTEANGDENLHKLVSDYFTTENFGVQVNNQTVESKEDERARKLLQDTTKDVGGKFVTGLLWREDNLKFGDNFPLAYKRLLCLEKQLEKDSELASAVKQKIAENFEKGYARKLTTEEAAACGPRTWYLPIFAVKNPHKPGKVRVVYDAAAKFGNMSLNDRLLTGPDLLRPLTGVLWQVREGNIAVAGDIKDMFHRIFINEQDQQSQRFLWRDCDTSRAPEVWILNVMSFGAKCSPSSAQFVKNFNAERFRAVYPRAVTSIVERHYVDDMLDSFNEEDEAIRVCREVIDIHQKGNFEIGKWISNSVRVMKALNGTSTASQEMPLSLDGSHLDKILGLYWNTKTDTFTFKLSFVRVDPEIVGLKRIPTKREILRTVASIYDPLGFASAVTVHAKILLQELWRRGFDWDVKISDDLNKQWESWIASIKLLESVSIPRCYCRNLFDMTDVQLHTFVDASENAFAAVCYFRIETSEGVQLKFVGSKTKVAPKKHLSMPRLELQAAVLGARLANSILNGHTVRVSSKFFWSDAQTVISWIKSDHRRYKQFVANRVAEILEFTLIPEWLWIPSKLNVADEATKPQKTLDLTMNGRWFGGPDFLKFNESKWPVKEWKQEVECTEELRPARVMVSRELASKYEFIDESRFSKWSRLLRTVGWVLRAKECFKKPLGRMKLRKNTRDKPGTSSNIKDMIKKIPELSVEERSDAENLLFQKIQWESFPDDFLMLKDGRSITNDSKLKELSPYFDSVIGLVRMRGRIDAAPTVSMELKRPIILSREHRITGLMIAAYHGRFHHQFSENVVNEIRQRFWIPQIRAAIKGVVKTCQKCKIKRASPQIPEMSPLPPERLAVGEDPFTYSGMDYFGPVLVTVGRHHEKRYGVIFTCLTTRAVHVELASSLDTSSCIMVVRNFMNRRGPPKEMMSDNGSNLRGAEAELRKCIESIDQKKLEAEGQVGLPGFQKTKWKFVTPLASHMAGVWERQVQNIKKVLYECLHERAPKEEILRSFLIEAEGVVNSRPLTYLPVTPDTQEALTPNHFLRMSGKIVYAPGKFGVETWSRKSWRYAQQLSNEFWRRFVLEYLPVITKRTKWFTDGRPLQVGDLVVIVDENAQRNVWERGIVEELHTGPDNRTRSATVRTAINIRKRPVAKLAVLDVEPKIQLGN